MKAIIKRLESTDFLIDLEINGESAAHFDCNAVSLVDLENHFRLVMEHNGEFIGRIDRVGEISFEGDFSADSRETGDSRSEPEAKNLEERRQNEAERDRRGMQGDLEPLVQCRQRDGKVPCNHGRRGLHRRNRRAALLG